MRHQLVCTALGLSLSGFSLACQNSKSQDSDLSISQEAKVSRTQSDEGEGQPAKGTPPPAVSSPEKWNYPDVAWTTGRAGLARIKESGRPGLVVLQGEWCPHCRNYASVFEDAEIEQLSESFELILIDDDTPEGDLFDDTGNYVPRTLFLRPDGSVDTTLTAPNPRFPHFFSVKDKADLTRAMKTAIARYGT